jgi:small subunit ribosomal protein S16
MLTIRMQRTGRSGTAMFRVVVQDSRQTPTSGKVVALLGNYNPHTKSLTVDKEKAAFYVEHGAQPSPRVARLLGTEGVKLPKWVVVSDVKQGKLRNPDKLRRNRPAEAPEAKVEEVAAATEEKPAEDAAQTPAAEATPEPTPEPTAEAAEEAGSEATE